MINQKYLKEFTRSVLFICMFKSFHFYFPLRVTSEGLHFLLLSVSFRFGSIPCFIICIVMFLRVIGYFGLRTFWPDII